MKKFHFNLEALLVLRGWEQRKARQKLAEATAKLNEIRDGMDKLRLERDAAFGQWDAAGARFAARSRVELGFHVTRIEQLAQEAQARFAKALDEREKALQALNAAARDLKVVENLREKRVQEHRAESFRQEAAAIDDAFNARRKTSSLS